MKKYFLLFSMLCLGIVSFAQTQMDLPVTFDDVTVNYGLVSFGGTASTIVTDPTLSTNKVGKVIKSNTAESWAGTTITVVNAGGLETGFATNIPFTASATKMNVRVWSPHAGIQVRLKVEDKNDVTHTCETEATVTTASGWQTLEFNFANQAAGTAALNLAFVYNKASIFFNFGVTGATAGERTYYFDDVKFGAAGGGGGLTQMSLPVTFDDVTVDYGLVGFGGAEQSTIVTDPTLASNKVAKVIKTNTAELWAGTTITAVNAANFQTGFATNIPFTATETKMNVRVWSPHAGIQVRLKVEDKNDVTHTCETEATVTTASGWQTLEFNFANQAAGTAALNLAFVYNKASIFFNFGVTGATAGERIYYFDDVKFGAAGGGGGLTQMSLPVTFDDVTVDYGLVGFGGAEQSTIVTDPTLASNKVAKVIKTNTAELWAGTTITAVNAANFQTGFATNIPFTATETKMNVRVWSPHAGIQVRLKVEDKNDVTHTCETEATVTTASGWQTLEFNFANQAAGTAALNLAFVYNKASIFFNFGVTGATAGERIYYFDDVKFGAAGGGGGLTQMSLPVTFDDVTVDYGLVGFGGAEQSTIVTDPTLASNKVAKVIKTNTAELWAGTTITAVNAANFQTGFATNIPFTATETKMNVRVWSPHAGIQVRLKVEDKNDVTHTCETEATVTTASGWQTLEFNFANQAAGTAALNLAFVYNKASIFFNFGVTGATAGERIYYFDDVKFGAAGGGGGLTQMDLPVTFDDVTVAYGLASFGGTTSTIETDPTLATNKVGKVIKSNTAESWAGTTITVVNAGGQETGFATNIPFTASATKMNVRVWSPHANIPVRLKVEDKTDPTKSCETEATVTTASGWQTLEFNFANQATGTAALNLAFAYNKASIFFNFGTTGATAGERTYYFDDVKFGAAGGGGGLTQMDLPVTFDDVTVAYGLASFGGTTSTIETDPTLATNKVGKVIKSNTAELWAGTTITVVNAGGQETGFATNIPFTASATKMNVRVWSPHANIPVRLKVEDKTDPTKSCETEATVTTASGWQTLEFNFANQATGTAALNLAFAYNKASIFFNFGTTGATAGERTYYFDDVKFGAAGGGGGLTQMDLPVTFDDVTVNYGLVSFGGTTSTIETDPTLATNKVGKVIKSNTAELWAGTTITVVNAGGQETGFATNIPFTASATKMNVRVWSPHANIPVRLKVEDKTDPTKSCETEATVTTASGWQTLEFNFANQATGTAALNLAFAYNKASIFFNFGTTGATAGERTYYFDDVKFGAIPVTPPPVVSTPLTYCQFTTASSLTATVLPGHTLRWYTTATGGTGSTTAPIPSTATPGTTNHYVSQMSPAMIESVRVLIAVVVNPTPAAPTVVTTPINYCLNTTAQVLTAQGVSGNTLKWYTVATGGTASLSAPLPATNIVGDKSFYVSQTNSLGCESQRSAIVVSTKPVPATPFIVAVPNNTLQPGQTTTITTTISAGNIYTWFKDGVVLSGQTSNSVTVDVDGFGAYSLRLTNSNACTSNSNTVVVSGVNRNRLFIYPNPSTGKFQVRYFSDINNLSPRKLTIYNAAGKLVYSSVNIMSGAYTPINVDLTRDGNGVYFVHLMDNNGAVIKTERILISH